MLVRSHTTLDITGVHFVVHSGATLTLQAPAISVKGLYVSFFLWPSITSDATMLLYCVAPTNSMNLTAV